MQAVFLCGMCAISGNVGFKIGLISLLLLLIYILQYTSILKNTYTSVFKNTTTNTDNSTVDGYTKQNRKHFKASESEIIQKHRLYEQTFADIRDSQQAAKNTNKTYLNSILKEQVNILNDQVHKNKQNSLHTKLDETSYNSNKGEQYMISKHFFKRNRNVKNIDCLGIFNRDRLTIKRALSINVSDMSFVTPEYYLEVTKNCTSFIEERGYITHHLTEEERTFPIAYSILTYKNPEQVERLLRAIYRPQNIYCIHVDSKTNETIYNAMSSIANCFDNIFLLSKRINVKWGELSVLKPELLCMDELWKRNKKWKYFINLTGQEFPLKTNYELVQILKAYNGSNDVEATLIKHTNRCKSDNDTFPPHGIRVTKGAVHVAVTRGFVDYSLHDPRARDILAWMKKSCRIPDEAYFTTLNHNPHLGVPGSYKGHPETTKISDRRKPYLARFKNRQKSEIHHWPCHGKRVREMCIFAIEDLPLLSTRRELFANKFHLDEQPLTFGCLEELIFNRTRDEYQGNREFDASWYSNLGFVSAKVE